MRKLTIIVGVILMISLVVAIGLSNVSINLTKPQKQSLIDTGITSPTISNLECDDNYCRFTLYEQGGINKQLQIPKYNRTTDVDFTDQELITLRDKRIAEVLELIADVQIERTIQKENKGGAGTVTINEK